MLLHEFLQHNAPAPDGKVAIYSQDGDYTYGELRKISDHIAVELAGSGFRVGDRAIVQVGNHPSFVAALLALSKVGGVLVPLSPSTSERRVAWVLRDTEPAAYLGLGANREETRHVIEGCSSIRLASYTRPPGHHLAYEDTPFEVQSSGRSTAASCGPRVIDADAAAILYTSGSTGYPKGVVLTHANLVAALRSVIDYLGVTPEDRILSALPLSSSYGLYQPILSMSAGATMRLERSFTRPLATLRRLAQWEASIFPGVPTIFSLMKSIERGHDFPSVRCVTSAGASLPRSLLDSVRKWFSNAEVLCMYGLTECKRVAYLPHGELDRKPGSVGKPIRNVDAFVADEDGRPLAPGEVGELMVRGSLVMQGYWRNPSATEAAFLPGRHPGDRLLKTGDLFRMDGEGFLYFMGRRDDVINTGGHLVNPSEVESVISELDGIAEAVVSGEEHVILGEVVVAHVFRDPGRELSCDDVLEHCRRRLDRHMIPRKVVFTSQRLPKTDSGKLLRPSIAGSGWPSKAE